jgi:hypothetical protein
MYRQPDSVYFALNRGRRQYELKNHLGNVLATVSDRKLPKDNDADALVDYYKADVLTASDYYPFGMQMPGRHWTADSSDSYTFGHQGQLKENELYGDGNSYVFKHRISDNRIGRFFSVDPIAKKYPYLSPYSFSENRLVDGIELEGKEYYTVHVDNNTGETIDVKDHTDTKKGHGERGPGVEYVYHLDRPKRKNAYELTKKKTKFFENIHGVYAGHRNPQINGEFDGNRKPVDELDKYAKQHDKAYGKLNAAGPMDALFNPKTLQADKELINKAEKIIEKYNQGKKDDVTGEEVSKKTYEAAKDVKNFFEIVTELKKIEKRNREKSPQSKKYTGQGSDDDSDN